MIKKTVRKARNYFDQSKTVKKLGAGFEKIPSGLGRARRKLARADAKTWYGKTGKWTGAGLLLALQAAAKVVKIMGVDNLVLRAVEIEFATIKPGKNKKGNDKKFATFIKKHPWIPAYLTNYMIMASFLFGANVGGIRDGAVDGIKSGVESLKDYFSKDKESGEKIDISTMKMTGAQWCKTDFVNALCVAIPLVFEECYTTAKLTSERGGVYNIGYCMTRMPANKSKPYGKWRKVRKGDTCTEEQAALWAAVYSQKNIFPTISEKLTVEVSCGMILALADLSYNAGALGVMIARLNDGWTEERVLNRMLEYRYAKIKNEKTGKMVPIILDGLIVRRWWDYAAGHNKLDYEKLLDCNLTAVSQIGSGNLYSDKAKYKPIITDKKVEQVLTASVPGKPSVRDIFSRSETGRKYIASIENADVSIAKTAEPVEAIEQDSESYLVNNIAFEAQTAFDKGHYKIAADKFRKMIELVPDAYDSYNDLIFTLYKLGNYDEGLKYARILIDLGHANDVSEDKMFGSAYFNAGLCREAKGELEKARANYETASLRMPNNIFVKNALDRIDKKIKEQNDKKRKSGNSGKKKSAGATTSAKSKFNRASSKIKNVVAEVKPEKGSTFDATYFFINPYDNGMA
ncbi:MAG: hypothetical protein LBJ73_00900 [Rickettsiales bacterium]|jgi:tetratricopeptide (TPR) repeat protein|nr:hypothetical protein [Rickettsiales bacterium]